MEELEKVLAEQIADLQVNDMALCETRLIFGTVRTKTYLADPRFID